MHAASLESELSKMGWRVYVVTLDNLPLLLKWLPHLVEKSINSFNTPLGFYYKGRITRFLYRHFINLKADFRIFEDVYMSWNSIVPSVTILHAVWSDNLQAYPSDEKKTLRLIAKEAAAINEISHPVITVSRPYCDYLIDIHFSASPLTKTLDVIELGLDLSMFDGQAALKPETRSMIYCGALEARKNVYFMLKVFKNISKIDPSASLTIVGAGPEKSGLVKYARAHKLNVTFVGRMPHVDVISALHQHSIYLHTSRKESFSFSLLEAKLSGLTTCALSSLEVPKEFIDVGFEEFNEDVWAQKIVSIDSPPDMHNFPDYSTKRMTMRTLNLVGLASVNPD